MEHLNRFTKQVAEPKDYGVLEENVKLMEVVMKWLSRQPKALKEIAEEVDV